MHGPRAITEDEVEAAVAWCATHRREFGLTFGRALNTDTGLLTPPGQNREPGGQFFVAIADDGQVVGTAGVFPSSRAGIYELRKMYL